MVLDHLGNSHLEVLHRVRSLATKFHEEKSKITLMELVQPPLYFHDVNIQAENLLRETVKLYEIEKGGGSRIVAGIHFAALKSVSGA